MCGVGGAAERVWNGGWQVFIKGCTWAARHRQAQACGVQNCGCIIGFRAQLHLPHFSRALRILHFTHPPLLSPRTFPAAASGSPLEILEALTPVMSATVFILSLVWEHLWVVLPRSIFFASFQQSFMTLLLILMGAVLAFLLVWTEYQLIKV